MIRLTGLVTGKKIVKEQDGAEGHLLPEDMSYFKEQIATMLNNLDEMHQEIGSAIEVAGDETGYDVYNQMEAQLSRYMEAAKKSLEYADKYLTRMEPRIKSLNKLTEPTPSVRPTQGI
jgi:hypothetical protein